MEGPGAHALSLEVAAEILAYLARNPGAGDTATGIWQWWLSATRARVEPAAVERVLEGMVLRNEIVVQVMATGQRVYFGPAGTAPAAGTRN